ncbi:hypothetical protein HYS92_02115 [Candidatus Daviesbacteria bacterium]|nr:hypothetical protein [Candidatus Daviesbacteria bacterium]
MDNIKKLLTKKVILGIFAVVIGIELIWAATVLFKPTSQPSLVTNQTVNKQSTTIKLETQTPQVKVGSKFTVSIQMVSDKFTDGADILLSYDPNVLSLDPAGKEAVPVILGGLYNEYPLNTVDAKLGKVAVSGIATEDSGILANGLFGSMVFTAKVAGNSQISVDFTEGSTKDSNVIETGTGEDILSKVENLEVNIE